MKVKINLDTLGTITRFVNMASQISEEVMLTDNNGFTVSGKSLLGSLYAQMEFKEIWMYTEKDRYFEFKDFIIKD